VSEEKLREELQDSEVAEAEDATVETSAASGENEPQGEAPDRNLEQDLAGAQQEISDLRDKMLRMAAENENFKKRMERERLQSMKYAGESIFREILPVVDNLERAISTGLVEGADAEKNLEALVEGVQLTLKSLIATLEKFEVKAVESVGQPFNPIQHEAMVMEANVEVPANHVLTEFEKGYFYKDRLLRAAKVVVSSGP
jgi:molecular chaperone GrpE